MLKKGLVGLVTLLASMTVLADVELKISINDVYHLGDNERTGGITFEVNDDDFKAISTAEPAFIRIRLTNQAVLSETLVDLTSSNTSINTPIHLAMSVNLNVNINPGLSGEAISIVRWVRNEDEIWIRIQAPTNTWVFGGNGHPQNEFPVAFTIGVSARQSDNANDHPAQANLPFNTRDAGAAEGDYEEAHSTLICVDLTDGGLEVEELLEFDPQAFDDTADNGDGTYEEGSQFNVQFSDDRVIARGKDRSCSVSIGKGPFGYDDVCIPEFGGNDNVEGWISVTSDITFYLRCLSGTDYINTSLHDGAYFTFSTESGSDYGFSEDTDLPGLAVVEIIAASQAPSVSNDYDLQSNTRFVEVIGDIDGDGLSDNVDLYRTVHLFWRGDSYSLRNWFAVNIQATVWMYYTNDPTLVTLDWTVTLTNSPDDDGDPNTGLHDDYDADGDGDNDFGLDHQVVDCPSSEFVVDSGEWNMGMFDECVGAPVSIFFPFVPRITDDEGNSTGFWSGLSVVNQGRHDFANGEITLFAYTENGDQFVADMPALDQRQQMNFVLANVDGTSALWGQGGPAGDDPIIPLPTDNDVPADSFGMYKMSMFVYGQYAAQYNEEVFLGDLDGYLLIGTGIDTGDVAINGAYLPRNERDPGFQTSDTPPRFTKK